MSKTSKQPKRTIGLIDDTPLKIDFTKTPKEIAADMLRQVKEPFDEKQNSKD
ncbi:hypothetical protein D3C74_309070 [compost metagenome]